MPVSVKVHSLFKNYSLALKDWIENTVYLHRYPQDNNVTIVYSTPDRAWAEYIYPVINGGTLSPNINFHLEEMEYLENENLLGFAKEYNKILDNGVERFIAVPPPLVYKLTYSATFFTRTQTEQDTLFYQLLSKAHKNKKSVVKVDGQIAEIWATNPVNETDLSPSGTEDIVRRGRLNLIIERAYLPLQAEDAVQIDSVNITYNVKNLGKKFKKSF